MADPQPPRERGRRRPRRPVVYLIIVGVSAVVALGAAWRAAHALEAGPGAHGGARDAVSRVNPETAPRLGPNLIIRRAEPAGDGGVPGHDVEGEAR